MLNDILILDQQWLPNQSDFRPISWHWNRAWPSPIMSGFHGAFATGVACQQGTLTLPNTWFRPPLWDLLVLQLLRPDSSNLPCLYSTFHLEYPLVLSRFCFTGSWMMQWSIDTLFIEEIRMKNCVLLSSNLPSVIDAKRRGDKFDRSMTRGKLLVLDNDTQLFIFISILIMTQLHPRDPKNRQHNRFSERRFSKKNPSYNRLNGKAWLGLLPVRIYREIMQSSCPLT